MSKNKGKKGKKTESEDVVSMKSVIDILLDEYKDPESLTLAQQQYASIFIKSWLTNSPLHLNQNVAVADRQIKHKSHMHPHVEIILYNLTDSLFHGIHDFTTDISSKYWVWVTIHYTIQLQLI